MRIETTKRLKVLSIAICFIFALSTGLVWASPGHHNKAGTHGKSEGSGSKKHHKSYAPHKSEGSKSRTWGRGTYKKGHGHSTKHAEGSKSKKHGGHYAKKGHHVGGGHSAKGYGHASKGHKGGHSHGKKDPFKHVLKFKRELGLTDAQVTEIKNQQFEYEKVSIRSHADHKIAHMELDRVIHSENVDETKARQIADKIAETKTRKIKAMVEGKLAVMRTLTADQKRIISRMYNRHN